MSPPCAGASMEYEPGDQVRPLSDGLVGVPVVAEIALAPFGIGFPQEVAARTGGRPGERRRRGRMTWPNPPPKTLDVGGCHFLVFERQHMMIPQSLLDLGKGLLI